MFSRGSATYRGQERRRGLIWIAGGLTVLYLILAWASGLWTDLLWFDSVGYGPVFRKNLLTSVLLAVAGFVVVFGFVWLNLVLADRLSPRVELLDLGDDEELIQRYREWVEPRLRLVRLITAVALAVLLGVGVGSWRNLVYLFSHPVPFGVTDPQFGLDISFYVFRLPLWSTIVSWATNVVLFTLVLVSAVHYLNGGIRITRGGRPSVRHGVKFHVSLLAAVGALVRAAGYWLGRYDLLFDRNTNGFYGAGYTDVSARLPALELLTLVAVVAAVLFAWNIRRAGWTLAWVSIGGWLFVSFAAGAVYPEVVQQFQVKPNPFEREQPYISRAVEATRRAYGLDGVDVRDFNPGTDLTAQDVAANSETLDNLRMWDPDVLVKTFQNLQEIRQYYRIDVVDTDRYTIDGKSSQVMVAARELDESTDVIPTDWQNQRLIYTHGFGAVLSYAAQVESDGKPRFLVKDVPPVVSVPDIGFDQPRIYFGETYRDSPVIVGTGTQPQELDFPLASGQAKYDYQGDAGVSIGNLARRVAFALRYQDLNMLISPQVTTDSKVLMHRNIRTVINQLAPFLAADADPYPVVIENRVVWVMDMYTLTGRYPYSKMIEDSVTGGDTARLAVSTGLPRSGFNYLRNSVKATVDAFDGTVTFYVSDPTDPIIEAWEQVYPGMFQPMEALPPGLIDHLRYPQDQFKIQSEVYNTYHMTDVAEFFQRADSWQIPSDPATPLRSPSELLRGDDPTQTAASGHRYLSELLPSYLLIRLPGETDLSYVLSQSFNPDQKNNMSAVLMADSTPGRYGRLVEYRLPRGSLVEGAGQVGKRIEQDPDIAAQFTFWRGQGSDVILGDMHVVPINDSILYVQPVFLEAEQGGLPEFQRVIVAYGDSIEWDQTLPAALARVFGTGPTTPTPGTGGDTGTVNDLIDRAWSSLEAAHAALTRGDLGEYQRLVEEAQRLLDEARNQLSGSPSAGRPIHLQ